MERQVEFERWRKKRLLKLTLTQRLALEAVELSGGASFYQREVRFVIGGKSYRVTAGVLRFLIREGLVEVQALGPARYRVTRLGRLTRSLRK